MNDPIENESDAWFFFIIHEDYEEAKQNYYDTLQQHQQRQQQQNTSLINRNDIINKKDNSGMTALHLAINNEGMNGGMDFIQNFLLSNMKIDVTIRDNDGNTPLHIATQFRNAEIVKLLVEHDEEKNSVHNNDKNDDAAFRATTNTIISDNNHHHIDEDVKDEEDIMSMIYIRNNLGETPLYNAVQTHNIKILKLLLSYDAKCQKISSTCNNTSYYFNMPDNNGISPIQFIHQQKKILEDNLDDGIGLHHHDLKPVIEDSLDYVYEIITLLQEEERIQRLRHIYQFIWKYHHKSYVWSDCFQSGKKKRRKN